MYQQAGYVLYQLIRALKGSNSKDKKQALEKANEQLGMLQTTVYLIYHIKAISPELYQEMANSMNELGPMLGGFIRSIRT